MPFCPSPISCCATVRHYASATLSAASVAARSAGVENAVPSPQSWFWLRGSGTASHSTRNEQSRCGYDKGEDYSMTTDALKFAYEVVDTEGTVWGVGDTIEEAW